MALLATQNVVVTGLAPTYSAAAGGGDTCAAGRSTYLVVKNAGGSPVTVTVGTYPDTSAWGTAIPDLTVSVPATTGERWIGPFTPDSTFLHPDGTVHISYSGVTSVTVGCFSVPI